MDLLFRGTLSSQSPLNMQVIIHIVRDIVDLLSVGLYSIYNYIFLNKRLQTE